MTKQIPAAVMEMLRRRARIAQGLPADPPVFTPPPPKPAPRPELEEVLRRQARLAQGLPADEKAFTPPAPSTPKQLIAKPRKEPVEARLARRLREREKKRIDARFGQLTVVSATENSLYYNCLCAACGQTRAFSWFSLEFRQNPTCGCIALSAIRQTLKPRKGKSTEEERLIRREREKQRTKASFLMHELEEPREPDFRTHQLRMGGWIGEGCRWVRPRWPLSEDYWSL